MHVVLSIGVSGAVDVPCNISPSTGAVFVVWASGRSSVIPVDVITATNYLEAVHIQSIGGNGFDLVLLDSSRCRGLIFKNNEKKLNFLTPDNPLSREGIITIVRFYIFKKGKKTIK